MEDTNHTPSSPSSSPSSSSSSSNSSPSSSTTDNSSPSSSNSSPSSSTTDNSSPTTHTTHHTTNASTDSSSSEHSDSSMSNPVNDKVDTSEKQADSTEDNTPFDLSYFDGIYKTKEKDGPLDLSYFESPYDKGKLEEYLKSNVESGNQLAYNSEDFTEGSNRVYDINPFTGTFSGFRQFMAGGINEDFTGLKSSVRDKLTNIANDVVRTGKVSDRHMTDLNAATESINEKLRSLQDQHYKEPFEKLKSLQDQHYKEPFEKLKREVEFAKEKAENINTFGVTKNTGISSESERQRINDALDPAKDRVQRAYESRDPAAIENAKQDYERVANRVKQDFEGSEVFQRAWNILNKPEVFYQKMEEKYGSTPTEPKTPTTSTSEPARTESVPETPTETTPVEPDTTESTITTETTESTETGTEEEIPEEISSDIDVDVEELVDAMEGIDKKGRWWHQGSDEYERVREQIKMVSPSAEDDFMDFAQDIDNILNGSAGQKVKAVLKLVAKAAWDTFNIIPKLCIDMTKDIVYRLIKGDYDTSGLTDAEQRQVKRFVNNKHNVAMMNSILDTIDKPIESSIRGKGKGQATDESDYNEGITENTNDVVSDATKKYIISQPWLFKAIQRW